MAEITVGNPNATLRAVETAAGNPVPIAGTLNWTLTPSDGSVAELAPGTAPDTMVFIAKGGGVALVRVDDPQFGLTDILSVTVFPAPPPTPDAIKIEFTPGS